MDEIMILDGYNVIHAWPELARRMSALNLEAAREALMEVMIDYRGSVGGQVVVVFDAHSSPGATALPTECAHDGVTEVYTARDQTADSFIEILVEQLRRADKRRVIRVVTGDALEQGTVLSFGAARMTTGELRRSVAWARERNRARMEKMTPVKKHELESRLPRDIAEALEAMRKK